MSRVYTIRWIAQSSYCARSTRHSRHTLRPGSALNPDTPARVRLASILHFPLSQLKTPSHGFQHASRLVAFGPSGPGKCKLESWISVPRGTLQSRLAAFVPHHIKLLQSAQANRLGLVTRKFDCCSRCWNPRHPVFGTRASRSVLPVLSASRPHRHRRCIRSDAFNLLPPDFISTSQTTPKASSSHSNGAERNPFDTMQPPAMTKQASRSSLNSSIISNHLPGDVTPGGMRTPGGIMSQSAIPTTSISLNDPDFTMKLPPAKPKSSDVNMAPAQSATNGGAPTSDTSTPAAAAAAAVASTAASSSSNSPSGSTNSSSSASKTRNTNAPRGHLTVKIVAGRNLAVSSPAARPYAVIQFDKNEFIGREPIDESGPEAKGVAQPRSEASEAGRSRAKTVTPADALRTGQNHNPVWKHEVTFDVTQDSQPIYISVYDRHSEDEGFLGMREIKPRMVHKMMSDQWYPLSTRDDEEGMENQRGEIRVQISYERTPHKKLTPHDFEYLKLIGRGTSVVSSRCERRTPNVSMR